LAREFLAEVLGTFLLCLIGLSSVAQYKFFAKDKNVNFFPVNLAFGLGATAAGIF
jgi:glycerol uptake facilitator-like aquaporin